jgi:hypothetical protein
MNVVGRLATPRDAAAETGRGTRLDCGSLRMAAAGADRRVGVGFGANRLRVPSRTVPTRRSAPGCSLSCWRFRAGSDSHERLVKGRVPGRAIMTVGGVALASAAVALLSQVGSRRWSALTEEQEHAPVALPERSPGGRCVDFRDLEALPPPVAKYTVAHESLPRANRWIPVPLGSRPRARTIARQQLQHARTASLTASAYEVCADWHTRGCPSVPHRRIRSYLRVPLKTAAVRGL